MDDELEHLCSHWFECGDYEAVIDTVTVLEPNQRSAELKYLLQLAQKRVLEVLQAQVQFVSDLDRSLGPSEVYAPAEIAALEQHIERNYGPIADVIHEPEDQSQVIKVDIYVVAPSKERPFYTLITLGMGAHKMAVPLELPAAQLERAEIIILLPATWKLDAKSLKYQRWSWPLSVLKTMARLGLLTDSYVSPGYVVDYNGAIVHNSKLCGWVLLGGDAMAVSSELGLLPKGEVVNFYQLVPLHQYELAYALEHDWRALLAQLGEFSTVVDVTRPDRLAPDRLAPECQAAR